ncbi:hypothetical protein M413DRAFT_326604 [Hebeloma cylindrosporum]|uniref:Uncharacterized protein n=1 Tax=Hebeloma cylindrosporum TaxID=76867 RepID=A0A0C3BUC6_HEBCY|nr:hypothetical protein M413DRAFT_326604 [Hebeloma cylindrosporum h7]
MNFMSLESERQIEEFSAWVSETGIQQVINWWKHKTQNTWILPSLIKSCSKMNPEDWDRTPSTTNLGEAQHHWTNVNTALKTSLLEAILLARKCDERTSAEIQSSHTMGVLKNHRNDAYTRMSRNLTRVNTSQRKQAEADGRDVAVGEIENEITLLTKAHHDTRERLKSLKASKTELRKRKSSSKAESNSSGRVRTSASAKTKKTAKVAISAKTSSKKTAMKSKEDLSLNGSSTANQAAASLSQVVEPVGVNFSSGPGGDDFTLEMNWLNNGFTTSGIIVEGNSHSRAPPLPIKDLTPYPAAWPAPTHTNEIATASTASLGYNRDYLALSEGMGDTTTWNFGEIDALDNFERAFGAYAPQ